jgi:hypothetical protein
MSWAANLDNVIPATCDERIQLPLWWIPTPFPSDGSSGERSGNLVTTAITNQYDLNGLKASESRWTTSWRIRRGTLHLPPVDQRLVTSHPESSMSARR